MSNNEAMVYALSVIVAIYAPYFAWLSDNHLIKKIFMIIGGIFLGSLLLKLFVMFILI
jgi:hypothetical protein